MPTRTQFNPQPAQLRSASFTVRLTVDVNLTVAPFPSPLPFPELQRDHSLQCRALDACIRSSELDGLLAYVLARDAKVAESIAAGASIPTGATVRRAAAEVGDRVLTDEIARRAGEGSPRDVPTWLLDAVLSRLDVRSAAVGDITVQSDC